MARIVTSNYRYTRPPRKRLAGGHSRDSTDCPREAALSRVIARASAVARSQPPGLSPITSAPAGSAERPSAAGHHEIDKPAGGAARKASRRTGQSAVPAGRLTPEVDVARGMRGRAGSDKPAP